jgi:cytochrome c55X
MPKIAMKFSNLATVAALLLTALPMNSFAQEKNDAPVLRADAKSGSEPVADLAAQGQQLYAHHCSHCHGFNMVNAGTIAFDLRKFPHGDKDRFVHSVTYGKNNRMPSWGDLLTTDDIDKLWAYVSSYKQP